MCPPLGNFGFCLFFSPSSLTSWYFFSTYLPHTGRFFLLQLSKLPSSRLDSVTFPQTPFWNAANDYYIKAEWITGKSFLPQHCQSILPNWRKSGGERERDGVFLGTKNCRMSAFNPNSAPHYFHSLLFFFTLQTSPPPPHPCHTHPQKRSPHNRTHVKKDVRRHYEHNVSFRLCTKMENKQLCMFHPFPWSKDAVKHGIKGVCAPVCMWWKSGFPTGTKCVCVFSFCVVLGKERFCI